MYSAFVATTITPVLIIANIVFSYKFKLNYSISI